MKVAHVTLYPPQGEKHVGTSGVASYSKNLVSTIPLKNDQYVICDAPQTTTTYKDDNAVVHRVFKRKPSYVLAVHQQLKRINPDVVHIQQELALYGNVITAYLLQWLVFVWRKKTVITLHGVVDPTKIDKAFVKENNSNLPAWVVRLAFRLIYTPLMRRAKHIIVHEQYFKDIIVTKYNIKNSGKISVVPHGVEQFETKDAQTSRQELALPKNANLLLFMGYATGYKGIDLLIDGFSAYAKRDKNAYLVIGAGKHPKLHNDPAYNEEYKRLQQKAMQHIPKNQYEWRGFIEEQEIETYYSASDVTIFPYTSALSSSGPMAFAIGYEKPFLVSDAFVEIFSKYPDLLFAQNATALADRLTWFFANRQHYGHVSTKLKHERSWDTVGHRTLEIYNAIPRGS